MKISEDHIQKTVMEWVRMRPLLSPYVFHIPNGGDRTVSYRAKLKKMGLKPGVSDLFVALPRAKYCGMFLELKSEKGRLSVEQKVFLSDMEKVGYLTKVCFSIEEAIQAIEEYASLN